MAGGVGARARPRQDLLSARLIGTNLSVRWEDEREAIRKVVLETVLTVRNPVEERSFSALGR